MTLFLVVLAFCVTLRIHAYGLRRIHERSAVAQFGIVLIYLGEIRQVEHKYAVIHLGIGLRQIGLWPSVVMQTYEVRDLN